MRSAPGKAIQFGHALPRLIRRIVDAPPHIGLVFLSKTNLSDAYMQVWVQATDVPKIAFSIPPLVSDKEPLIGFHLSLPLGYVESAAYFCAASETVANFANAKGTYPPHPLEHKALTLPWLLDLAADKIVTPKEEATLAAHFAILLVRG